MQSLQSTQNSEIESYKNSVIGGLYQTLLSRIGTEEEALSPQVQAAREHLAEFMIYTSNGRWIREKFLEILCSKLEDVAHRRCRRLMIFVPPRHGKTEVVSRHFPAWYLGKYPDDEIIMASYAGDLAWDASRFARNLITTHPEVFGEVMLATDSRSADRWVIAGRRGGVTAAGVGGPITGRGGRIAIIDDPIKYEEAQSVAVRERVWSWYRSTLRNRLTADGAIIIMMTRSHEEDLAGKLLACVGKDDDDSLPWEVIDFPAIAEKDEPVIGRKEGEALSVRYPIKELLNIKRDMGPYLWNSLYQQHPRPEAGDFFQDKWFGRYAPNDLPPRSQMRIFASADLAIGSKEINDRSVILVAGLCKGLIYILDAWAFLTRENEDDIADRLVDAQEKWNPINFGIEDGKIRKAVWPTILRTMKRRNMFLNPVFLQPWSDKVARAKEIQARAKAGVVMMPLAGSRPWADVMMEELLAFPTSGRFDDHVDAFAWLGVMFGKERGRGRINMERIKA